MGSPDQQERVHEGPGPLLPIGIVVIGMLLLPAFLYSIAPGGPIREGDTVFSTGRHRVQFAEHARSWQAGYQNSCVLEPGNPLIVTQRPSDRPDGSLLARVQGNTVIEFPFCPSQAEVIVKAVQVLQKEDLWRKLKDRLRQLFPP